MASFLDQAGGLWMRGALNGKVGGAFASAASQHGGQETTLFSIITNLLHFGLIVVGMNYGYQGQMGHEEVVGGGAIRCDHDRRQRRLAQAVQEGARRCPLPRPPYRRGRDQAVRLDTAAKSLDSLIASDAVALVRAIRTRQVSAGETLDAFLGRIDAVNSRVNAIVAEGDRDVLRASARSIDDLLARRQDPGPLAGLPIGIKDLHSTSGLRTTMGSPLFADWVPAADSIAVGRIRAAGAIIVGKTNSPEFGLGSHTYNPVYGATGNAFDPTRSAGGSSGGAAVALALDMVPLTDGSDYGGSLRNPAGWNNVFGLRPSAGRVPAEGPGAFMASMGVVGPMARSVEDLGLFAVGSGRLPSCSTGRAVRGPCPVRRSARRRCARPPRRLGWRLERPTAVRAGRARDVQGGAQPLRGARLHRRRSRPRLFIRAHLGRLAGASRLAGRGQPTGALPPPRTAPSAQAGSSVRGRKRG